MGPRQVRIGIGVVLMSVGLVVMGEAAESTDSPEARALAAAEFLAVVPVDEEVHRIIGEIGEHVPEGLRQRFVEHMNDHVDMAYMKQVMRDGLVEALTAAQLKAAATFFGSPEGKVVREKLPLVIDHVMPLIREELMRTARELQL